MPAKIRQQVFDRGLMTIVAETTPMPPHFDVHPNITGSGMMLKDRRTGKHVTVPMMAYFDVRRVLQALDL